jgi:hypothetical protein
MLWLLAPLARDLQSATLAILNPKGICKKR